MSCSRGSLRCRKKCFARSSGTSAGTCSFGPGFLSNLRFRIFMTNNISVFGLGKLGASMVAGMASRGFNVIGVDVSKHAVDAVNQGSAPVQETGLDELIA